MLLINLELSDGNSPTLKYSSLEGCLQDAALTALFDEGVVLACSISVACGAGETSVAKLYKMTWPALLERVIANSVMILRHQYQDFL